MVAAGLTVNKKILLLDRSKKNKNDRTWCFWEESPGFFEPVVCKEWKQVWFHSDTFSKKLDIDPYRYKMIKGIDFYNYCFSIIEQQTGIEMQFGEITGIVVKDETVSMKIGGRPQSFQAKIVFNSLYDEASVRQQNKIYLLQHFKGWTIETAQPFFKPEEPTLMDFRVDQSHGTTFAYVLPVSTTRALVEYTFFSENILRDAVYNKGLSTYIDTCLHLENYRVVEEEFGVIPMTTASFPWYCDGMYHIGTAGGQTKASSGYTFRFIQQQSAAIVQQLKENTFHRQSKPAASAKRFQWYDKILLRVLTNRYATGSDVFTQLFKKNKPVSIFRFLDNQSSLAADINIMQSLPVRPFLQAAIRQMTGH